MTVPQSGDLFVRLMKDSVAIFSIGRDRQHPQESCRTYDEALRRAMLSAEKTQVDVWYTADGVKFEFLAHYRDANGRAVDAQQS
jgi:hypothetical protein